MTRLTMPCPRCHGARFVDAGVCHRCEGAGTVRTAAGDRKRAEADAAARALTPRDRKGVCA